MQNIGRFHAYFALLAEVKFRQYLRVVGEQIWFVTHNQEKVKDGQGCFFMSETVCAVEAYAGVT